MEVVFEKWKLGRAAENDRLRISSMEIRTTSGQEVCAITHCSMGEATAAARQIILDHNSMIDLTHAYAADPTPENGDRMKRH